jgi:predicted nucleic acid-binding protein
VARVVIDSNILLAARLERDTNHERATPITDAIDHGTLPTAVVLSDVLAETLNYLNERAGHAVAAGTLDALIESSGFEIVRSTKSDFDAGRSLFRTYEVLSLTDGEIAAHMQRTDREYLYSFDDDFDAVEHITRLETADNPFA